MIQGRGIIFLQKDKFDFYSPGLIKIIEFRFVPEIIHDLEVINRELLENLIKLFVSNNKIAPGELTIVLADNACFIKDFIMPSAVPSTQQKNVAQLSPVAFPNTQASEKVREDIKFFIDHVPFENVLSREFHMGNGTKVLAVNKDFFEAIKNAFEKAGFRVNAVLPGVVFENNIGAKQTMDIIVANTILKQADYLRDNDLLREERSFQPVVEKENEEEKEFTVQETESKPGKTNKKRLFAMIGIFVILLIILVVVYLGSLQQTP